MKAPTFRTFSTAVDYLREDFNIADKKQARKNARHLMRKMVENEDYDRFKSITRKAASGDMRMNFSFEENSDKIYLSIADRKTPTISDAIQTVKNMFRKKGEETPLPTMSDKECRSFLKDVFNVFKPFNEQPVRKIEIDPEKPYAEEINTAIRELANQRLFGGK